MRTALLLSLLFVALTLTACGSGSSTVSVVSPEEMNTYIESNPDLSDLDKACILNGEFKIGMGAETVIFLLGEPITIAKVSQPWGEQLVYTYKKGGRKVFTVEDNGVVGIELDD